MGAHGKPLDSDLRMRLWWKEEGGGQVLLWLWFSRSCSLPCLFLRFPPHRGLLPPPLPQALTLQPRRHLLFSGDRCAGGGSSVWAPEPGPELLGIGWGRSKRVLRALGRSGPGAGGEAAGGKEVEGQKLLGERCWGCRHGRANVGWGTGVGPA